MQVTASLVLHFSQFYMYICIVLLPVNFFYLSFLFCFSNDDVRKNVDNAIGEV